MQRDASCKITVKLFSTHSQGKVNLPTYLCTAVILLLPSNIWHNLQCEAKTIGLNEDEDLVFVSRLLWSSKKLWTLNKLKTNQAIARLLQETSTIVNQLMAAASRIYLKWFFCKLIFFVFQGQSFPASLEDQTIRTTFSVFRLRQIVRTALMSTWWFLETFGNILAIFSTFWQHFGNFH